MERYPTGNLSVSIPTPPLEIRRSSYGSVIYSAWAAFGPGMLTDRVCRVRRDGALASSYENLCARRLGAGMPGRSAITSGGGANGSPSPRPVRA